MAFDAICTRALKSELIGALEGAKIDKIYMPEKDEITVTFRTRTQNFKLTMSASSSNARVHFTNHSKENPKTAPNFCMILRKHLLGGKVLDIVQPSFERVLDFYIESYTEMGDLTVKHLICEIMGRHSNIILTDENYKILDSIKHIDFTVSSVRQVLPGLMYEPAPKQEKVNPLTCTREDIILVLSQKGAKADKLILNGFLGLSPIIVREILARARVSADTEEFNSYETDKLADEIELLFANIKNDNYSPCIVRESAGGKMLDFSAFNILQYGLAAAVEKTDSVSDAVDKYYYTRDALERQRQKSASLVHLVQNHIDRCAKKIIILSKTVDDAKNMDKYKLFGDLIISNIYRIKEGDRTAEVENYFSENAETVKISLDPSLTPQKNAQKYYKKYTKAKVAAVEAARQREIAEGELSYMESVMQNIAMAQNESELSEIKNELSEGGYLKRERQKGNKKSIKKTPKPMHFISSDGFDIYCGKNNVQNDYLTLKMANNSDIWFHTKDFAGSHTVIKLGLDKNVPDSTIYEAALIAAYYSSVKSSAKVPVDYTQIKNVRKPNGAKPGMVIYDFYKTIYVVPDEEKVLKLKQES